MLGSDKPIWEFNKS